MKTGHPLEAEAKLFSKDLREKQDQTQNTGANCKTLSLADRLSMRPKGWFHIEKAEGRDVITVHRPDALDEVIICVSPGHANQVRQQLSDAGLTGLVEGAL
ncbi:hypothetical protein RGQ15_14160 [Paracoccus sp. MBLB3053]|uniref:Uncharacterized protein n=1 Tax=Paracoccus aurantius TaxID=3073814 RepID=A0ABU2HUH8_9RHOB|nr:hypothetical protein [Paracoccus sp. MBLB3053]MDS9468706.1 hypothetical protein [Paracoccus sp. MBLB3053]